jgi:hypothetical protein
LSDYLNETIANGANLSIKALAEELLDKLDGKK